MGLSPRASTPKSTEPLTFLRDVGKWYRASGRTRPLMDQLAVHPYPNQAAPRTRQTSATPRRSATASRTSPRVKQAVWDAFHGTAQPTTLEGLTFRIDEIGWQVDTKGLAGLRQFRERGHDRRGDAGGARRRDGAGVLRVRPDRHRRAALPARRRAVPQRPRRKGKPLGGGWQSGLVTVDGQQREAYRTMGQLAAKGRGACAKRQITWSPRALARRSAAFSSSAQRYTTWSRNFTNPGCRWTLGRRSGRGDCRPRRLRRARARRRS